MTGECGRNYMVTLVRQLELANQIVLTTFPSHFFQDAYMKSVNYTGLVSYRHWM